MNKMEYIKLMANFLGIDEREDWKESNKGNLTKINLNTTQDQAYIRCEFKRFLTKQNNSTMIISTNRLENYKYDLTELDFSSLNDRNKLRDVIENCCDYIFADKQVPVRIKFEA